MKKVINGKMYNTDTAKEIGNWTNNLTWADLDYIDETLYQKKTGEYFLYCCGGAMTKYSETCSDGSISSGRHIIPMSEKNAEKWLKEVKTIDEN